MQSKMKTGFTVTAPFCNMAAVLSHFFKEFHNKQFRHWWSSGCSLSLCVIVQTLWCLFLLYFPHSFNVLLTNSSISISAWTDLPSKVTKKCWLVIRKVQITKRNVGGKQNMFETVFSTNFDKTTAMDLSIHQSTVSTQ